MSLFCDDCSSFMAVLNKREWNELEALSLDLSMGLSCYMRIFPFFLPPFSFAFSYSPKQVYRGHTLCHLDNPSSGSDYSVDDGGSILQALNHLCVATNLSQLWNTAYLLIAVLTGQARVL